MMNDIKMELYLHGGDRGEVNPKVFINKNGRIKFNVHFRRMLANKYGGGSKRYCQIYFNKREYLIAFNFDGLTQKDKGVFTVKYGEIMAKRFFDFIGHKTTNRKTYKPFFKDNMFFVDLNELIK